MTNEQGTLDQIAEVFCKIYTLPRNMNLWAIEDHIDFAAFIKTWRALERQRDA